MLNKAALAVWGELARSRQPAEEDFNSMVGALSAPLQNAARRIDIALEVEGFSKWLRDLIRREPPNPMMKGLFLGLGERTAKSFKNYTVGKVFFGYALGGDSVDSVGRESDSGCWRPEDEWVLGSVDGEFWDSTGKESTDDWFLMLGVAIICARHFFRSEGQVILAKADLEGIDIRLGFPEGDLYQISVGP